MGWEYRARGRQFGEGPRALHAERVRPARAPRVVECGPCRGGASTPNPPAIFLRKHSAGWGVGAPGVIRRPLYKRLKYLIFIALARHLHWHGCLWRSRRTELDQSLDRVGSAQVEIRFWIITRMPAAPWPASTAGGRQARWRNWGYAQRWSTCCHLDRCSAATHPT